MSVALRYTIDGPQDAPVVVLGSSVGSSSEMWEPQVSALSQHFRVLRYDHRGHGGSPVPPAPYTLDELGGDVLALLDSLGLERVHLGGLSLGGMVGMWVGAHAPERIDKLVLLCTAAKLGPPEIWDDRIASVRAGGLEAVADATMGRWFTADFAQRRPEVVAGMRKLFTSTPEEGYIGCARAIQQMDLTGDLGLITAPTLVIAGADDPSTPPAQAELIAAAIRGGRTAIVPDAAHLANIEQPDVVTRLLVEFLGDDDDRAG
jgi:3-oxoadipate enol-lactonase